MGLDEESLFLHFVPPFSSLLDLVARLRTCPVYPEPVEVSAVEGSPVEGDPGIFRARGRATTYSNATQTP